MEDKMLGAGSVVTPEMAAALDRWRGAFYGRTTPQGGHPAHLAATLCAYLATLVTGELEMRVTGGQRAAYLMAELEPVLGKLQQAVELAAAEGMCVLHPVVEGRHIRVEFVPAHRFFPTALGADGRVEAGYFADFRQVGKTELVRLEAFQWDDGTLTVENRVYRLKGDKLERELPLDTLEDWKDLEKSVVIQQVKGPLLGVLKMPFLGTVDPRSPLPVSLLASAEESLMEFDRLYGELLYELHSGKRKRILERQALPAGRGKYPDGLGWQDLSTDTYLVLDPMEQQKPFDDYSPVMRTEEYLAGLKAMLHLIENQCHLSPGTLSLDTATGSLTATEVVSRDRTSYNTCRAVQEQGLRQGLMDLVDAMDALCDLYELCPVGAVECSISFGDSVFEDVQQEFDRRLRLVEAGCLKPQRLVQWYLHLDPESARAELPEKGEENGH